jgi:uncharacterized protein
MLLDTSGLYCYLDAADARHQRARTLLDNASVRVTHNYVLAELIALCNARRVDRGTVLAFLLELMNDPSVSTVWVGEHETRLALALLQAREDKSYSLCDAASFVLMRQRGLTEALTTDHHFEQEGFVRLLEQ